jgi:hypothetical protein
MFSDFAAVLIFATVAMLVLAATAARYRAWPAALWFFVLIFLGTWALAAWFEPLGVPVAGTYWTPFALTSLVLTLIIAAVAAAAGQPQSGTGSSPATAPPEEEVPVAAVGCTLTAFFWAFVVVAIASIVAAYL